VAYSIVETASGFVRNGIESLTNLSNSTLSTNHGVQGAAHLYDFVGSRLPRLQNSRKVLASNACLASLICDFQYESLMSTDSFPNSAASFTGNSKHRRPVSESRPRHDDTAPIDRKLIQETRDQIRALVDEITELSQTNCSPQEFYEGFLTRTTRALASIGGAIWSCQDPSKLTLEYQINLSQSGLADDEAAQSVHHQLLRQVLERGEPVLVPPKSGSAEGNGAFNPTDHLLILGPLVVNERVVGVVEVFQRPEAGPTTQRGYLRFLVQMCKAAGDYLRNQQLRKFTSQQMMWNNVQTFVRAVHGSLDVDATIYAIANEGRRLLNCDRVSVAVKKGSRLQVEVMSGLDTIERRADQIKALSKLVTVAAKSGEPMHYAGDDSHLPPQLEKSLHEYLDLSHAKLLFIEPLRETVTADKSDASPESQVDRHGKIIGALMIEQLGNTQTAQDFQQRIQTVIQHSDDALTNSLTHSGMFLAPVWTWLGKTAAVTHGRNLPKTAAIVIALLAALAALWCIPYPFTLGANGVLVPENRSEVWAEVDGVLKEIRIPENPDEMVNAGDVLAIMTNNDLMVEIRNLQGQLDKSNEEVNKLKRAQHASMTPAEARMIGGELAETEMMRESLLRQLELKSNKAERLEVRAPASGHIFNWQLRENLLRRPVSRGQNLMTIVHPETPWEIELAFPERRIAHLLAAYREAEDPLPVTFTLASHPGQELFGTLRSIDNRLDVRGDEGNVVRLRVAFDETQLSRDLLRSGTRVSGHVRVGQRSLGYVWFHELIETAHNTWLLWF